MRWQVREYDNHWFIHVIFECNGYPEAFTQKIGYNTKADAEKAMAKCWRASISETNKLVLFRTSNKWSSCSPFDPRKVVHVEEHWRRPWGSCKKQETKLKLVG